MGVNGNKYKSGEMRGMIFYTLVASASLKIIYGSAHSPMSPCCRTFSNCQRQKLKIKLKKKTISMECKDDSTYKN